MAVVVCPVTGYEVHVKEPAVWQALGYTLRSEELSYEDMTVAQLKELAISQGKEVPKGAKKQDIIELIRR